LATRMRLHLIVVKNQMLVATGDKQSILIFDDEPQITRMLKQTAAGFSRPVSYPLALRTGPSSFLRREVL
jgi:hypothetical protein